MPILLLPDLIAILLVTAALAVVARHFRDPQALTWAAALCLIDCESLAHLLYMAHTTEVWHRRYHALALAFFLVAGLVFFRSATPLLRNQRFSRWFFIAESAAAITLSTVYGMHYSGSAAAVQIVGAALLIGGGAAAALKHERLQLLTILCLGVPMLFYNQGLDARVAIYASLALLYASVGIFFALNEAKQAAASLVTAAGFLLWSASFATHPWMDRYGPQMVQLASQIWDMHKFAVSIGFLLMLFEREAKKNQRLALHDQLTDLPNRRLFDDRLAQAAARAERDGSSIVLFNLDLNDFKMVNDSLGHAAGDEMLCGVVANLQRIVRKCDTLARIGGDEFALLVTVHGEPRADGAQTGGAEAAAHQYTGDGGVELSSSDGVYRELEATFQHRRHVLRQAHRVEMTLREAVAQPVTLDGHEFRVTTCVGLAIFPDETLDIAQLARIADTRMYAEKQRRSGRRGSLLSSPLSLSALDPTGELMAQAALPQM